MKNRRFVRFVFGSLLVLLPVWLSAGPWEQNRSRPSGFQRTLGYLEGDLYNYPDATLQQNRNKILHDDLTTTLIPQLQSAFPPSSWEAEGQKAYDSYAAQYAQLKTIIRQTMTNPEGLIQAVENNQPLGGDLLAHPNARALILLKWQMLNVAEQTYQALLYAGRAPGAGRPGPPTDIGPPKPTKSKNQLDWERMRETRRKAIERRKAYEARMEEEYRRRWAEILEIIRYLRGLGAQSSNKFKPTGPSAGGYAPISAPPEVTPMPTEVPGEPAPAIEEIEQLEEQIEEVAEKIETEESTKVEKAKVKVYRGTLILHRIEGLDDAGWTKLKDDIIATYSKMPQFSNMVDKGDEVTWRYKALSLPTGSPPIIEVIPDGEPTEEVLDEEPTTKPAQKPKAEGNGDNEGIEKDIPGSGPPPKPEKTKAPAKPETKPTPKPEPKPEPVAKAAPGYWYDPTDEGAKDTPPIIYVRIDGVATRMDLDEAKQVGVPAGATIDTMTWYSERTGKIVPGKDRGTHRGSNQPASTNKFAKPKP